MRKLAATETEKHIETDMEGQGTTFDQASREATGARPYGRYLEEFEAVSYTHLTLPTIYSV